MVVRIAVAALLALVVATSAGGPDGVLTEEARWAFDWFDGLGYPDLANAPFVRIYTGASEQVGDAPWTAVPDYGFLLGDDGKKFHVFTVGLKTVRLTPTGPKKPAPERVAYERIPLADYVREGLQHLGNPPGDEFPWEFEPFGHRRFEPTQWFRILLFARACVREGHPDLAHQLWKLMEADEGFRGDAPVLHAIQEQVAEEALQLLIRDFRDPDRSWADLLARCRWWREKFAAVADPKWVNAMIPMLESVVAVPADEPEDRVARLILRLREASARHGVPEGAGKELVSMGLAAVPQLLAAWDDERPSRCIAYEPTFKGYLRSRVSVVRVGTHVRAIVGAIAGREFADAVEARLWDAGVRRLEEKAVLVGMVSEGCKDAARGARLLQERYPDAAEAAILAGLANAGDEYARSALVTELRPIRTEATTRFLVDETGATDPDRRAQAAWLLLDRDRADGVAAVAEAWRSGSESREAWWFLCNCGRSEAITALEERFDSVSVDTRFGIVGCFILRWWPPAEAEFPAPDAKWAAGVESLLVHALADARHMRGWLGQKAGMSPGWRQYTFTDPRVCDVAACALREMFPDRYHFDWWAPAAQRDRQLVDLRNRWRTAHDLPALPKPR